ncbi:sodium-independent anion transporter [Modestobacter sp. VKM Ac-2676]|nr:sodium-independent anion transporter [Modestobacter sp. VKM Ac-2676]
MTSAPPATSALPARPRPRLSRPSWLSPSVARTEILAGLVVALALIPEAISFSILAGVDPRVGLYSSFVMAVVIAFTGGRPAMITAATGAIALVVAPLALQYGVEYLFAAIVLGGIFQILLSLAGFARLMRFIPRSVMVGFVNALAILIFTAQLPYLVDVSWLVYPMVAAGLAIIFLLPRLTSAIPAPLVSIVVLTGLTVAAALTVPNVGDQGELPDSLPFFGIPAIPFDLETLTIIAPYALGVAFVGLMESLMTAKLVDDLTDTPSNKTRESWGQGTANIASGFFGGMGGCAMIGQTMINVKSGARTRLSTFLSGVFLLVLVVALGDIVAIIPMAALVAVMIFVAIATFDWHSLRTIHRMPRSETTVMLTTVAGTLITHNLAIGVAAGVLVACVLFARRVAHLVQVTSVDDPDGDTRVYQVSGALFFASSNDLYTQFDYAGDPENIVIDLTDAHIWDASTVAALDAITHKYETRGKQVQVIGLTGHSADRYDRHTGQLAGAH